MARDVITVRRANERGHLDHGWLDTWQTFSFAEYHDPRHGSVRHLRVIDDDRVRASHGFLPHGHRDMEIITYVLGGALEHKDDMGNDTLRVIAAPDGRHGAAGSVSATAPAEILLFDPL